MTDAVDGAARRAIADLPSLSARTTSGWSGEVTVLVTTFERPCCIARFLVALRGTYPDVLVLVADASHKPLFETDVLLDRGIEWLALPPQLGRTVGAARNYLLDRVETPYFFLCDDDHVVTGSTDLARMHDFLLRRGYDIIAGGQGRNGFGVAVFERRRGHVWMVSSRHRGVVEPGVVRCDRVENTFLARTATVRDVGWEPRLQGTEHDEFFLRALHGGVLVAQMGQTWVLHDRRCETATNPIARVLSRVLPIHRDRSYRRTQVGAPGPLRRRARAVRQDERSVLMENVGVKVLHHVSVPLGGMRLRRLLAER